MGNQSNVMRRAFFLSFMTQSDIYEERGYKALVALRHFILYYIRVSFSRSGGGRVQYCTVPYSTVQYSTVLCVHRAAGVRSQVSLR